MLIYKLLKFIQKLNRKLFTQLITRMLYKCGKGVHFEENVTFDNPDKIYIEDYCSIKKGTIIRSRVNEKRIGIKIGKNVKIHEYSYIDDYGGKIYIDDNSGIGQLCIIGGQGGVHIGKNCMIAGHTYIIPANHRFNEKNKPFKNQGESKKGIRISDNVWVGAGCIILDGVSIGRNTVIGAGSVVTRSIPSNVIAVGIPARVIKEIHSEV